MEGANQLTLNLSALNLMIFLMVVTNGFIRIFKYNTLEEVSPGGEQPQPIPEWEETITVRYNRTNYPIKLIQILYIESMSDYVKIVTDRDVVITKQKISHLHKELPVNFLRTHRSYIVNKHHVTSYNKESLSVIEHQIPISRTYKKEVLEELS